MLKETIQDISSFGGNPIYFAVAFFFLITKKYPEFWTMTLMLIIAYLVTMAIRFTWWEERPDHQKYKTAWEKFDSGGFPSLHAARAAMLALPIMFHFNNILVTIVLAVGVAATAYARVWLKRHHPRDVIAGIILGAIIYFATAKFIIPLIF
ncbi:MAG: phosphatase PAP2 family protein [Candidatus Nanoarchaeia archaeon]